MSISGTQSKCRRSHQQVLEGFRSDTQLIAVRQVGGAVVGQHPVQHQDHPGAVQLIASHRG
jgi:hypothetical protein